MSMFDLPPDAVVHDLYLLSVPNDFTWVGFSYGNTLEPQPYHGRYILHIHEGRDFDPARAPQEAHECHAATLELVNNALVSGADAVRAKVGQEVHHLEINGPAARLREFLADAPWEQAYRFQVLEQVAYVPAHAYGKLAHPDVERGFVSSDEGGPNVFCRYWRRGEEGKALRTLANSEATPRECLVRVLSATRGEVRCAWKGVKDDS